MASAPFLQTPTLSADPAQRGIKGNSHMIMQDKNHLQIADLILEWINERVSKRPAGNK